MVFFLSTTKKNFVYLKNYLISKETYLDNSRRFLIAKTKSGQKTKKTLFFDRNCKKSQKKLNGAMAEDYKKSVI